MQYDQIFTNKGLTDQEKTTASINANLLSVNAQITGTEAAIAAIPDGEEKDNLLNKLRRYNDKRDNLLERLQKGGAAALLDAELDAALLTTQITEIDTYLGEVAAQKATL